MTTKPMSRPMPSYLMDRGYKVWNYAEEPLSRQSSILNHSIINNNNQTSFSLNSHTHHSHHDNRKDLGKLVEETVPEEVNEKRRIGFNLSNPYLNTLEVDRLLHLGLTRKGDNLVKTFGDVKFVCTGESVRRMEITAQILKHQLNIDQPVERMNQDVDRFTIFKVGPILCVNHGIGVPSLTILLNEIFKLLAYARCQNVTVFRLGTCGSIGKPPGTLIITNKAVDDRQRPLFEQVVLGRVVSLDATVDQELVEELRTLGGTQLPDLIIETGTTMATNDFYEGQGRMNGAFCGHTFAERGRHLLSLKKAGIINIEMEANAFFALCAKAKLKCACVDVVACDRLRGDMSNIDPDQFKQFEQRPALLIAKFIQRHLDIN